MVDMELYACIDIGGTAIKYGLIDNNGEIVSQSQMPTEAQRGGREICRKVNTVVDNYLAKHKLGGVCISTAGMVDCKSGEIFYSGDLIPDYTGTSLKNQVEKAFKIPCEVENDVNCAGLAEYISGAAAGSKIAVCLTVGTGIGGCILIDGKVFHGYNCSACEVGYMHMEDSDFQTLGASSILTRKVAEQKREPEEVWDGRRIFKEAKNGDRICNQAIDKMTDILGKGIANICYVLNPEIVVLGGGIMAQKEILEPKIKAALCCYLKPIIYENMHLAFAKHKNNAGMLGAFYNFKLQQEKNCTPKL